MANLIDLPHALLLIRTILESQGPRIHGFRMENTHSSDGLGCKWAWGDLEVRMEVRFDLRFDHRDHEGNPIMTPYVRIHNPCSNERLEGFRAGNLLSSQVIQVADVILTELRNLRVSMKLPRTAGLCFSCNGRKQVTVTRKEGRKSTQEVVPCTDCHETGLREPELCSVCGSSGPHIEKCPVLTTEPLCSCGAYRNFHRPHQPECAMVKFMQGEMA